jgi:sugar phosphate isomerase/epimerase
MTLDTGHANIDDPEANRVLDFITKFGHRIGHVHLSDNLGRRDDHFQLGKGTIDFDKIARALNECGYDDTITLEIFSEDRRHLQSGKKDFQALLAAS